MRFIFAAAILTLSCMTAATPSFAQYPATTPAPAEIAAARNCLCLEALVQDRRFELDVRNGLFEQARSAMENLEREAEQRRPLVDGNDPNQIDAFRSLLARADAARTQYEQKAVPEQQQAVARYNAVVTQLNSACAGRSYSTYAWDAARTGLVCPR